MTTAPTRSLIAVIGSANLDIVLTVDEHPEPGQTILSRNVSTSVGGKGINQAIAAARAMTGRVSFIGQIGDDPAGHEVVQELLKNSVDATHLGKRRGQTGRAYIAVTAHGDNSIIVAPHVNGALDANAVIAALDQLEPRVVLTQLEIPVSAVEAAAAWCSQHSRRFLLNPSPTQGLTPEVLELADPVIVNQGEAEAIVGNRAPGVAELAATLATRARSVVVTAGAEGAFIAQGGTVHHIPAHVVDVVDTTGAGDCFAGTLAAALSQGSSLIEAVTAANHAASLLVQHARNQR
jgi:ribokinase